MLPHELYIIQTQSEAKGKRFVSSSTVRKGNTAKTTVSQEIESISGAGKPQKGLLQPAQRRGYFLNEETGRLERIIRKRKRKSGD